MSASIADLEQRAFPFGDPCSCGASSTAADPRDQGCGCQPCLVCGAQTGEVCAYCDRSLGCGLHAVTIDQHVATVCLASPEQRVVLDPLFAAAATSEWRPIVAAIRAAAPSPWPMPQAGTP